MREFAQTYKYDNDGKLVGVGQTGKDEVNYTYSSANLIQSSSKSSGKVDYTYDAYNNVKTVKNDKVTLTNNSGNITKSSLSSTGSSLTITSSAAYSDEKNRKTTITDTNGISVFLAYDSKISEMNGTPSREVSSVRTVNHSYDAYGNPASIDVKGPGSTVRRLASYTSAPYNGNPVKMKYGNDGVCLFPCAGPV